MTPEEIQVLVPGDAIIRKASYVDTCRVVTFIRANEHMVIARPIGTAQDLGYDPTMIIRRATAADLVLMDERGFL